MNAQLKPHDELDECERAIAGEDEGPSGGVAGLAVIAVALVVGFLLGLAI